MSTAKIAPSLAGMTAPSNHEGHPQRSILKAASDTWTHRALTAIGAGVLVFDEEGTIALANPRACEILARDTLLGLRVHDVMGSIEVLSETDNEAGRAEFQVTLQDGREIHIGSTLARFTPDEAPDGGNFYVCLFQEISTVLQLRKERDRLLQLAALNEVLPAMLHELRNPLAAIDAMVQVLIEEAEGSLKADLRSIRGEIHRISLNLQGVGAVGRSLRSSERAAIGPALEETIRSMAATARRSGVELKTEIQSMPALPLEASVVRGLAFNLVANAITACAPGQFVMISARLVQRALFEIKVLDNGSGMDEEVCRRCTELFYTTKRRGSGVGLALCARSVKAAGGSMTIQSEKGRGTQVTIRVPVAHE